MPKRSNKLIINRRSCADTLQFNLTPYKLFFPEKRQFFLENAGVFNFPLGGDSGDLLFFSRNIGIDPITGEEVPINGGGKVTGSIDGFELGAMDVETRSSGPNPYANYAVARVKRSLWGGSYIGVMGIDKRSGNPLESVFTVKLATKFERSPSFTSTPPV